MTSNEHEEAYEALIQFLYRAPIGLLQIQRDGHIEMLNPMSAQLLMPLSPDGNLENFFDVIQLSAPELKGMCQQFSEKNGVICDAIRIKPATSQHAMRVPEVLSVGMLKVDDNNVMVVVTDVTQEVEREQRNLARRIDSATRIDALTRLPNRIAVRDMLQQTMQRIKTLTNDVSAVLQINFDRFKQVNDSFGNATGDEAIRLVAQRLRSAVRSNSRPAAQIFMPEPVARVGADEFVVLLDSINDFSVVEVVAKRLLNLLEKPYHIGQNEIIASFSIGIVSLSGNISDVDEILGDASIATSAAKANGGAQFVVFEESMREVAARRGGIESELRIGLEQEQLFIVYQPVVGFLSDGLIDRSTGVEALIRWQHPEHGVVGPVNFIEIAEKSNLINVLGRYVLRKACSDFMEWKVSLGALAPRLLAVNLSRAQLAQDNFDTTLSDILRETNMPPEQLQLEITESFAAQDADIQSQLRKLKKLGVKLALDDFGTGYSSLSSLHLLPIDTVKIDRSFVSLADTSAHHEILIEVTVKVARSLGMTTVAEGIETEGQSRIVQQYGCDKGQGYLFSKPLVASELLKWIVAPT
ncbi:putative bifunctional diguanylate cyclase/phosphodiesterase [Undibacterium sp. RuRC25W]|uniref:putative bifunctional diguanylate cyclase/phosphodiesterase n=1 Tax=Undibacterium sp. RuRC25W TaxID=3413047 RepID=UPI003BF1D91E